MSKRIRQWAKCLAISSVLTANSMSGCSLTVDDPQLLQLLESALASGDLNFEFKFDAGGGDEGWHGHRHHDDFEDSDAHVDDDWDEEPAVE